MKLSIQREIQICQNKVIHSSFIKQIFRVVSRGKLWSLPEVRHIWSQVERWRQGLPLQFQQIFFQQTDQKVSKDGALSSPNHFRTYNTISHDCTWGYHQRYFMTSWPLYCVQLSQAAHKNDDQRLSKQAVTELTGLMMLDLAVSRCLRYTGSLIQNEAVAIVAELAPISCYFFILSFYSPVTFFRNIFRQILPMLSPRQMKIDENL